MKPISTPSFVLSPAKRALWKAMLQQEGVQRTSPERIHRAKAGDSVPTSFAQQRLWFIEQMEPGKSLYMIARALRIKGKLNVPALAAALTEIARRQASLRTCFALVNGDLVQRISEPTSISLPVVDLSHLSNPEGESAAGHWVDSEAHQPFDLSCPPLWRARLLKLSDDEHVFSLTLHHIISDGWSMSLLFKELSVLYNSYTRGEKTPLEELEVQYADYANWQRESLRAGLFDKQLSYWRQQLAGAPEVLELPADHPRPAVQTYRGATESFKLPEDLSQQLKALSQREDATLYMTLLAAFQLLLSRYSGQDDVVVGTPSAGRDRDEIQRVVGLFVNMLVLRTDLSDDLSFTELLQRVKDVVLTAHAHQDIPFDKLVEALQPERSLSYQPLFQTVFQFYNAQRDLLTLDELQTSGFGHDRGDTAKFDLVLTLSDTDRGLAGTIEYNTDLFETDTIKRLVGHYQTLLQNVIKHPHRRISELDIMGASERRQLLVEWNNTARPYSRRCIHEWFEEQVERTPEGLAVVSQQRALTYNELNEKANQLAHHLRSLGVGAETLAGVCLERSVEMVISLIAILKAGAAYLPLDASYPSQRIAFMLADAQAPLLLTSSEILRSLSVPPATKVLCHDLAEFVPNQANAANPAVVTSPEELAYTIYTSGSTGQPKGVQITHASLSNLVSWHLGEYQLSARDHVTQLASPAFDAAVWEIWPALCCGACIHIATDNVRADANQLQQWLVGQGITVSFVPTPVAEILLAQPWPDESKLRALLTGGDRLHAYGHKELPFVLINHYGPTESTVVSTAAAPKQTAHAEEKLPAIGHPIMNIRAYVLDGLGRPVPVGVQGELHIGGEGLARGYLNSADLTAEKFIPDGFGESEGARLYRTGDVVRWRPDGQLEYIGRSDHQVKIRGFRIELVEIEAALLSHANIREAIVVAHDTASDDKRLAAYVVSETGAALSSSKLRDYLNEILPAYMLPSSFITLDKFPLTPNGKVDRARLPEPPVTSETEEYLEPRTAIEDLLRGVWKEVLKLERVGVRDNFFALGGHSLLGARLVGRVRDILGVDVPLRTLFEYPTIAGLANQVEQARKAGASLAAPPIATAPRDQSLPLSFAQQRLWFLNEMESNNSFYAIVVGLQLRGGLEVSSLQRSLSEIVRRHESLRTSFPVIDGQPVQLIAEPQTLQMTFTDLSSLSPTVRSIEAQRHRESLAREPFDLERGPLFRAGLIKLDEEEHVLLLTMHHIVCDGWSMGVLFREISELYKAFCEGKGSPLKELPVQYADYSVWQREYLRGEVLETQLKYWEEQLRGAPAVLEMPVDRPRPAVQSYRGASESFGLTAELTQRLKELSQVEGVTLFMTLLAAFQVVLARYSGQKDIVVGSPIAGRTLPETEGLIGFFVNTLALRTDLSGAPTFREVLGRVRETCLEAYAHQELPFERLVEELQPERSLSHQPLFQVMFQLQTSASESLDLIGLRAQRLKWGSEAAKFDLLFSLVEAGTTITGELNYSTDLFDRETVQRILGSFEELLEGLTLNPEQKIADLPLLTASERQRLLVEWNNTGTRPQTDACVHELFEAQVARTPDAIAVIFGEDQITYRELNECANQLAHYLREQGAGPESLVGVLLERSPAMIVSLLAVLKAGAAYLPLDPGYPAERVSFMLEDAEAQILITQPDLCRRPAQAGAKLVLVDAARELINQYPKDNPTTAVVADNLAYVIYTSGSTGKPKGVAITHHSAAVMLEWAGRAFSVEELQRTFFATSVCFDLSVFELFAPLSCGGAVLLADNVLAAAHLPEATSPTLINTVPSAMAELVRLSGVPRGVRVINLAGEALSRQLVDSVSALPHVNRVWNLYGPTEDTTYSTGAVMTPDSASAPSIGAPLFCRRAYVLDERMAPVPIGVAGELYLGGEGLARGYLGQAGLTGERFLPDPCSTKPGTRLYRTGDSARWRNTGELEYLGRRDHQVKVRGYRIELQEVEATLARCPGIQEAAVVVGEAADGNKELVAYLVMSDPEMRIDELRLWLREQLPEFMVPAWFVTLDQLPLTPNGKIDRGALPHPAHDGMEKKQYAPPRTALEQSLVEIWADLLKVDQVGINDSFFELGGHSLLAARMTARVREKYSVELPLRSIFEAPTIHLLGHKIEQLQRTHSDVIVTRIPVRPRGNGDFGKLLAELNRLSEEDVQAMLSARA